MFSKLKKIKKNWFTMLELILVCTVFALLVSGIILAINRTYVFMNNTKVQIRATNLTREWMEMMFNIRDTNRRKCSWEKDRFWLYLGSGVANEEGCLTNNGSNDYIFQKWIYTIKEWRKNNGTWDWFIYAEQLKDIDTDTEIEEFYELEWFFKDDDVYNKARSWAIVSFTWTYLYLSWSVASWDTLRWEIWDLLWEGVTFYRIVRIYGIYDKNGAPEDLVDSTNLHNSDPKEMRFCVKTFYKMGVWHHSSELCSIMTNFME
jgi:hypothetical protein